MEKITRKDIEDMVYEKGYRSLNDFAKDLEKYMSLATVYRFFNGKKVTARSEFVILKTLGLK